MDPKSDSDRRRIVRDHYGRIAKGDGGCTPGCCGARGPGQARALGYSEEDERGAPDGADLGLGCGNPIAIASLRPGETVLDLGAGAGFDCFLAARQVGPAGKVIGVDMTPAMVDRARANAAALGAPAVEFRLGEIERLPVADASVDVVLSNCVINLSPDQAAVFREAFRVLRPGGRLAISDVVAIGPAPAAARSAAKPTDCVSGAAAIEDIEAMLRRAGFVEIQIRIAPGSDEILGSWFAGAEKLAASATIEARRPDGAPSCCEPACCT